MACPPNNRICIRYIQFVEIADKDPWFVEGLRYTGEQIKVILSPISCSLSPSFSSIHPFHVFWNDAVPGRLLGAKASTECDDRGGQPGSPARQLLHHPHHVASAAQELPRVPRRHLPRHRLARTSPRAPGLVAGRDHPPRQVLAQPHLPTSRPD